MLLGGKQSRIKQVAIVTRNQKFNRLLGAILAEWKLFAVEDPTAANVVFVERGLELPDVPGQVIWLTPLPLSEGLFLQTPISLTELYQLMETQFFPTPRQHLRVAIETRTGMKTGSTWQDGKLISLSDRGGRMVCEQEIPRGTMMQLELMLAGRQLDLPAEVLYCIPAGDSPGRTKPQVGLLFKPADDKVIGMLRRFIEKFSVEAACAREGISFGDPCLSWIDVPGNPWSE